MKTLKSAGLALLAIGVAFTSGCERHSKKETFYLVGVNMALPYWQSGAKGFSQAAAKYQVTAKVVGPENYDPQAELTELQKAVAAKEYPRSLSLDDDFTQYLRVIHRTLKAAPKV